MEKQTFKITINAPREKVWEILWNERTFTEWTSVFSPGSSGVVKSDWKEGSKILFLDANNDGMVSRIAKRNENEFMSFEHLGEVHKGVEDTNSENAKKWSGSTENYTLKNVDGKTELTVVMDIGDEYKDQFAEMWPKALDKLKSMAETSK